MTKRAVVVFTALLAVFGLSSTAMAGSETPDPELPDNGGYQEGIEADVLGSFCSVDIPYLGFRILPTGGFEPTEPVTVTLTISDSNGALVGVVTLVDGNPYTKSVSNVSPAGALSAEKKFGESFNVIRENGTVTAIEGQILYPLSDVTSDGTAIRWPGFILDDNGDYIEVPGEDAIRDGLTVVLAINPEVSASVEYPQVSGNDCGQRENSTTTVAASTTTLPGELPQTGSESGNLLQVAAIVLASGLMLFAIARRRNPAAPTPTG